MTRWFWFLRKDPDGLTPPELSHIIFGFLGICFIVYAPGFHDIHDIGQIMFLVMFLTSAVGLADLPLPAFKSKAGLVWISGLVSGFLDSFIVLLKLKDTETRGSDEAHFRLLCLATISALIMGLYFWFGELYAAPLYYSNGRTGLLSGLFMLPPGLLFLWFLGWQASRLPITIVNNRKVEWNKRRVIEFSAFIALLLWSHNAMLCLGVVLVYSLLRNEMDFMEKIWRKDTEFSVMGVLGIAWLLGPKAMELAERFSINDGIIGPIMLSAGQALLWSPLYHDPNVNFWVMMANLSTGAMILPTSSLVGVVIFKTRFHWKVYLKISIPNAIVWWCLLQGWIFVVYHVDFCQPLADFFDWAATAGVARRH